MVEKKRNFPTKTYRWANFWKVRGGFAKFVKYKLIFVLNSYKLIRPKTVKRSQIMIYDDKNSWGYFKFYNISVTGYFWWIVRAELFWCTVDYRFNPLNDVPARLQNFSVPEKPGDFKNLRWKICVYVYSKFELEAGRSYFYLLWWCESVCK